MSDEWISSIAFTRDSFEGAKPPSADSGTNNDDFSVAGSGNIPSIAIEIDYYLRDESGEIITDENSEPISLEGLIYAEGY